jgi:hypothetical protein
MSNNKKSKINKENEKLLKKLYKIARQTKVINSNNSEGGLPNMYDVDYLYDDCQNQYEPNINQNGGHSNINHYHNNGNMTLQQAFFDSFRRQYNLKN